MAVEQAHEVNPIHCLLNQKDDLVISLHSFYHFIFLLLQIPQHTTANISFHPKLKSLLLLCLLFSAYVRNKSLRRELTVAQQVLTTCSSLKIVTALMDSQTMFPS